ncbi:MAG TPA: hypothetical protein V6C86_20085 [Oculatellaceae cyanobacterium]
MAQTNHEISVHLHHPERSIDERCSAHRLSEEAHSQHQDSKHSLHQTKDAHKADCHLHPLHPLTLTDIQHEKDAVLDGKRSTAERLSAARTLLREHITHFEVASGTSHKEIRIEENAKDGRVRVLEREKQHPKSPEHIMLEDANHKSYTDKLSTHHWMLSHHSHHHHRTEYSAVQGLHYDASTADSSGTYQQPVGARTFGDINVDPKYFQLSQNPDGSKTIDFNGCNVDTDGASRHSEDACWQPQTSLRLTNGESLNTDLDNFVVLSASLARACGVKLGDYGYLVDKETGRAVPVVFGDVGPEGKKSAEASVHAIKQLGRGVHIDGNHGLSGRFQVVIVPHTGDHTGNIARSPEQIQVALNNLGTNSSVNSKVG